MQKTIVTLREIQDRLSSLKKAGFIRSARRGPTGIGHTLEKELGLTENNFPMPDIGGHTELKAVRKHAEKTRSLVTLFTFNRAAWEMHQSEVIERFGSIDASNRRALWSTVYYQQANPQNLKINLPESAGTVDLVHDSGVKIASWEIDTIVDKFISKLGKLLVVLAENQKAGDSGAEEFWFNEAYLYENPSPQIFFDAFQQSKIAIDVRMYIKPAGGVRNHGTGFRIKEEDITSLYANRRKVL